MLLSTAVSISAVYLPEMRLLVITILVILQRPCQGSEFVLLETESEAERDTGNMEGSEPASSSNGDYQDVSNQAKFGCQDCKIDMRPVYGHIPCTGCEEGNPEGSPFSCRACVPGEPPKFKCDDCQRNRRKGNNVECVIVKKYEGQSRHGIVRLSEIIEYYEVTLLATANSMDEICEAVGMRSVCNRDSDLEGFYKNGVWQGNWRGSYITLEKAYCQADIIQNQQLTNTAACANRVSENPNPKTGVYRLDTKQICQ